uniref:acetyl-CoA carboxylase beta subunit n=1 Tax=Melastoma penicillatum TaxID=1498187 RepID=UPI0027A065BF|nr:acetyl-CoA carboxylase beta subunit [Melastoma penicillatum]YP_010834858.1 acetyl-CoA carboxylase beta subunit [Melastoma sanguineum]WFQ82220.1 acetyl-CoA carboxylase beta subunit [Melastoma malabathricum subsp. normale]WFQ82305.1 acetyl-CoA carboxylase beta subunit [Melastoma penicillatum]WFQ82390.1 acetyl-CoA carboxylase beta subunit [Melastoma sanguineum]
MEKRRFNSMLSSGKYEYRYGLNQSIDRFGPIEDTRGSEDRGLRDAEILSSSDSSSYSNAESIIDILNLISAYTVFLVKDTNNRSIYPLSLDIKNLIFEIDNDLSSLLSGLERLSEPFFRYRNSGYLTNGFQNDDPRSDRSLYNIEYSWNNHINGCLDSYLSSQISIESFVLVLSGNVNSIDSYIYNHIFFEREKSNERGKPNIRTSKNGIDLTITIRENSTEFNLNQTYRHLRIQDEPSQNGIDLTIRENSTEFNLNQTYRHLWVQCENCYGLNYKKFFKSKMNICEQCGYHLKMHSSDRIELSIDPGTWNPMDEDMVSLDPIEFHSEEEPYKDRIDSYQRKTGLTEAVQTGTGRLNGISVAIGVMDFQFMGGSMGSVVGEKITRLIEYATTKLLPLILVCASGGARMQEGSLSLMQMAKISAALYDYQSHKKLFYVSILTSPTTGGVTASFGMLGDIIIAEPNAYIAFAGKRVIEQTLNKTVPEDSQVAEYLFHKGLFDLIVPRNPLKGVLSELFRLHSFFPWK